MTTNHGPFDLVYFDPPWRFRNWSMKELAQRGEKWARRNGRSPYNVMTIEDLAQLPIPDLGAKDSLFAMWTTDPKLDEAFKLVELWNQDRAAAARLVYVTVLFYWVKTNPSGLKIDYKEMVNQLSPVLGGPARETVTIDPDIVKGWHFGLGYHSRANPELCLLFKKGKGLSRVSKMIPRLIIAPVAEHSAKPNEARDRIIKLYGARRRAEIFARTHYEGFECWGNEIDPAPEVTNILGGPGGPKS